MLTIIMRGQHTGIGHFDLDHTTIKGFSIEFQSLLQTLNVAELNISEALGTHHLPIFNNSDADNVAAIKKASHGLACGIIGQVAQVSSIGRLIGYRAGDEFTNRIA